MPLSHEELVEYIEKQMETNSHSYFETVMDFLKWNTALAVGAILWFGNFIINTSKPLNTTLQVTAYSSLWALVLAIGVSIALFFLVSRYFNEYWVLCSEWRESVVGNYDSYTHVINRLIAYYKNLPKTAKMFDRYLFLQMILLCAGMGFFVGFIIAFKQTPT